MVSKIAVVALVLIVAAPIFLGYAMNLTETTESGYKQNDDSVNVTPLLQNDVVYTYAHANMYQLNSNNMTNAGVSHSYPRYENITQSRTSIYAYQSESTTVPASDDLWNFHYYQFTITDSSFSGYVMMSISYNDGTNHYVKTVYGIVEASYNEDDNILRYSYLDGNFDLQYDTYTNAKIHIECVSTADWNGKILMSFNPKSFYIGEYYADIAAGYRLINHSQTPNNLPRGIGGTVQLPSYSKSVLYTINLDSITDPNYSVDLGHSDLVKTTDGDGNVTWTITDHAMLRTKTLYYNPEISDNSYQFYHGITKVGYKANDPGYVHYNHHYEYRYVGSWPEVIGEANYYQIYTIDTEQRILEGNPEPYLTGVGFYGAEVSPVFRIDDALSRAFETQVIGDQIYTPADFRLYPATSIKDVTLYGDSLTFGGNNYIVSDGKITIGSHHIPVNGLVFSSVPDGNGNYNNMIGNTVISNTADPSTITFNGQWAASISTASMGQYTYTKTEWKAGEFGWDGIDQNFLIVGLITCLGVFIGCGIYARKSRSGGVIPLMIVTGCAAAVFFIML